MLIYFFPFTEVREGKRYLFIIFFYGEVTLISAKVTQNRQLLFELKKKKEIYLKLKIPVYALKVNNGLFYIKHFFCNLNSYEIAIK